MLFGNRKANTPPGAGGGSGPSGAQIARSVRFRDAASAFMSRTAGAPTDSKKLTIAFWIRRNKLGAAQNIINAYNGAGGQDQLYFSSGDQFSVSVCNGGSGGVYAKAWRDPAAWEHVCFNLDTTQATAANRVKTWFTGSLAVEVAGFTYPALNATTNKILNSQAFNICKDMFTSTYAGAQICDLVIVDGTCYDYTNFIQYDSTYNIWMPKTITGLTYGAQGGYYPMTDNSSVAALGNDSSGNGNTLTVTNVSVTSGVTNDSLVDSPSMYGTDTGAGGEVRGNYATWNPLHGGGNGGTKPTTADGNLKATSSGAGYHNLAATLMPTSGKWYAEFVVTPAGTNLAAIGIAREDWNGLASTNVAVGAGATSIGFYDSGDFYKDGTLLNSAALPFSGANTVQIAVDFDNGKFWMRKDGGTWFGGGDPAAGTSPSTTFTPGGYAWTFVFCGSSTTTGTANFGQRPFANAAPSGYKALCTQNMADPAVIKPSQYFDINLRTGTGANANVTGKALQPDFVWIKSRSNAVNHSLFDSVRGAPKCLGTNTTSVEDTAGTDSLTSFNADGFSLGANALGTAPNVNVNALTYVDWMWKKGALPGFDIVGYTGTGANRTVNHSLGVVPEMMIIKNRTAAAQGWVVYHYALGNATTVYLNSNAASAAYATAFNSTSPTSSLFTVGTSSETNGNTNNMIAYLFASVPGFSKFGTYAGNAAADGPFINCGFRPRYILVKRVDALADWLVWDTARDTFNIVNNELLADTNAAEVGANADIDILSNGFKIKRTASGFNTGTIVFAAFAEAPLKFARAR